MFGIYLQNTYLDLYPDTVLSFELNSPLYFGDDIDVLQGSFMFTINAPLTPRNTKLLRHPHIIDNEETFVSNIPAQVFTNGSDILRGSLSVTSATKREVSLKIQIGSDSALIDTLLSDFFKEDKVVIAGNNFSEYLYQTCQYPLDFPFIFHPVYNEGFESDKTDLPSGVNWQNAVKITQKIITGDARYIAEFGSNLVQRTAITPFLRLEYVLQAIFKKSGFILDNQFQTEAELKLITIYNNRTLLNWTSDTEYEPKLTVKLNNHLPNIKTGGWLKKIVRPFNQGLFIDRFENQATIQSALSVLENENVAHDWTNNLLKDYSISETKNTIGKFDFDENAEGVSEFRYTIGDSDKEYKASYMSLISERKAPPDSHVLAADISAPTISQEGSKLYFDAVKNADFTPRLMLYRGFADSIYAISPDPNSSQTYESLAYPLTACEPNDALNNEVKIGWNSALAITGTPNFPVSEAQHTLHWAGEKGIYSKYWSKWNTFLAQMRTIKMQLALTPRDVQNFKFQQKIRINNRIYLVKKLKLNITRKGLQPVEAELVSVL